jgi:hypothetical protein
MGSYVEKQTVKLGLVTQIGAVEIWCLQRIRHSETGWLQPKVASDTTQLKSRRHGRGRSGEQRSWTKDRGGASRRGIGGERALLKRSASLNRTG